mgnify:CR=1 FL=1
MATLKEAILAAAGLVDCGERARPTRVPLAENHVAEVGRRALVLCEGPLPRLGQERLGLHGSVERRLGLLDALRRDIEFRQNSVRK